MKGYCCDKRLIRIVDNPVYFKDRCGVCGRVYKQRKRRPGKKKEHANAQRA